MGGESAQFKSVDSAAELQPAVVHDPVADAKPTLRIFVEPRPEPVTPPPAIRFLRWNWQLATSRTETVGLAFVCAVLFVLLTAYWLRTSRWGVDSVEIARTPSRSYDFRLEINDANWVEWTQLDGIGDKLAHRIVADREEHGPFESIDDLQRIKGIGAKTVERLRPSLKVGR